MPPERTLLDYMSGGQYQTSGDIPPMIQGPRMSQAEMLTALHSLDEILNPPLPQNVQAPGLGLLEWADTGPLVGMKALKGVIKDPIQAIAPQSLIDLLFKKKPKVPALKTKPSGPLPGLDKMYKRMAAEQQGSYLLYEKFEQGMYPEDIAKRFFSEVYPNISPENQKQFRHWSQTGEYYPGLWNPKTQKEIDVPFDKQVEEYIYETFPSKKLSSYSFDEPDFEYDLYQWLEGFGDNPQNRGELAYMAIFNDAYDAWKASGKKAGDILGDTKKLK